MLRTANLSENLLISMVIAEKNEVVGGSRFSKTNKNLSKFQKPKITLILSNVNSNAKAMQFLNFEVSIVFI